MTFCDIKLRFDVYCHSIRKTFSYYIILAQISLRTLIVVGTMPFTLFLKINLQASSQFFILNVKTLKKTHHKNYKIITKPSDFLQKCISL